MKIAVVIDTWFPFVGGGQINAYEISKRLARKGIKIDVITRNLGKDRQVLPKNLRVVKLGNKTTADNSFTKVAFIFKALIHLSKQNYDLAYAHAFLPGITLMLLKSFNKTPTIFGVHGTSIGTNLNRGLKSWLEKFILTQIRYDHQITVSRDFLKIKNVNKKITYIPNGVYVNDFDKIKSKKFENPTLIFVGRLHFEKNLENLIKAVSLAKKKIPNLNLLIIGEGPEEAQLKKLTKNLNIKNSVKFLGKVTGSALIQLYKSSNIFILPSIYEGQPLTLLEAWAAKIPVIVTSKGDCSYLVKHGENGYLINNPNDYKEIADTIIEAFEKNNLNEIGQKGYEIVENNFLWDKAALKTLKLYQSLIS